MAEHFGFPGLQLSPNLRACRGPPPRRTIMAEHFGSLPYSCHQTCVPATPLRPAGPSWRSTLAPWHTAVTKPACLPRPSAPQDHHGGALWLPGAARGRVPGAGARHRCASVASICCLLCALSRLLVLQHGTASPLFCCIYLLPSMIAEPVPGAGARHRCAPNCRCLNPTSGSLPRPARRVCRLRHPQQRQQPLVFGGR